jgi:hypothetical protein
LSNIFLVILQVDLSVHILDIHAIESKKPEQVSNLSYGKWKNGKTLFKQGGPFSTKAGIHRGPVSRYRLFIGITF